MHLKRVFQSAVLLFILFQVGDFLLFSVLKRGMDNYYGMNKNAEVLCVGHSHTVLGVDAEKMEKDLGVEVAKYATAGANTLDRFWMINQFIEEHPSVKVVVYDVDSRLFDSADLSSTSYSLFLPYITNGSIGKYLKQEATWQEYCSSKILRTTRFRDQTINIALRGLLGKVENKKNSQVRVEDYVNYIEREKGKKIQMNPESVQVFHDSLLYLNEKGIEVLLVNLPVIDLLNDIDPQGQKRAIRVFEDAATNIKGVHYVNYNKIYQDKYECFYDLRHLNFKGNIVVTNRIINDLKQYIK